MTMTPPPTYPHQPPPPRRSGLKVYALITTFFLVCSLVIIMVLLLMVGVLSAAAGGVNEGPASKVRAETLVSGGSQKVAILPINGTIDGDMYERVNNFCEFIKNDRNIKAVVIEVDSPGGTVTASDEIYHRLLELKGTHKVVVSMRSLCASGGYYLAMASDKLYAQPTTLTGSIGVIWPSFQVTEMMKKIGVKPEFIKSENAQDFKDAGSPFKEMTDEDRAYIRGLLDNAHGKFAAIVDTGRRGKLTKPIKEIAVGKIWTADDAKVLGLIDEIAYTDEVCAAAARDAGISNPTIIKLKGRASFFEILGANSALGGGNVEVKLDTKALQQTTGAMEYRFTGTGM